MDDLATLTDGQLDDARRAILAEQERRARHAEIPGQLADLARQAVDAGCDPGDLIDAVTDALTA